MKLTYFPRLFGKQKGQFGYFKTERVSRLNDYFTRIIAIVFWK